MMIWIANYVLGEDLFVDEDRGEERFISRAMITFSLSRDHLSFLQRRRRGIRGIRWIIGTRRRRLLMIVMLQNGYEG